MNRIRLTDVNFTQELIEQITPEIAKKYRVVPVRRENENLWIARADWEDGSAAVELSILLGLRVHKMLCDFVEIGPAIKRLYPEWNETGDFD